MSERTREEHITDVSFSYSSGIRGEEKNYYKTYCISCMPLLIFIIASVVVVESLFGIVKRYLYYLRMRRITCVRADIISTAAATTTTTSWCRRPRSFFSHCEKGASSGRPDKCFSSFFLRFLPTTFPPLFSYSLL